MNGAAFLVMLIVGLGLAAGGAVLYVENARTLAEDPIISTDPAKPRLVAVEAFNITNSSARYVRIQVASDAPVRVNQTDIRLVTPRGSANLRYRNGTLARNVTEGFYTQ